MTKRENDGRIIIGGLLLAAALLLATCIEVRADHNLDYVAPPEPVAECRVGNLMVHGTTGAVQSCVDGTWTPMITLEESVERTQNAGGCALLVGLCVGGIIGYLDGRSRR